MTKIFPEVLVTACHGCPWFYWHKDSDYPSCIANSDDDELYFDPSIPGFTWDKMVDGEEFEIDEPWMTQVHENCPLKEAPEESVATVRVSS